MIALERGSTILAKNRTFPHPGGTALGTLITMMAGYALSRKELPFRNLLMGYFVFT